jgi:hypothetical protein
MDSMAWIEAEESSTTSPPVGETTFQGAVPSVGPSEVMSEEYPLPNFSADGCFRSGRKEGRRDSRNREASLWTKIVLAPGSRALSALTGSLSELSQALKATPALQALQIY